jgi:hypothetical protein
MPKMKGQERFEYSPTADREAINLICGEISTLVIPAAAKPPFVTACSGILLHAVTG